MLFLLLGGPTSAWAEQEQPFRVDFQGHDALSERDLRQAIDQPELQTYSPYLRDDIAAAVRDAYMQRGYARLRLNVEETTDEAGVLIQLQIEEGARYFVDQVVFEDNQAFTEGELTPYLHQSPHRRRPAFDRVAVRDDRRRLTDFHVSHGFQQVEITGSAQLLDATGGVVITHRINEGPQFYLTRVTVAGAQVFDTTKLLEIVALDLDTPYDPTLPRAALARLVDHYRNHGYFYARVELEIEYDDEAHEIHAVFDIDEGTQVLIGQVLIEGNTRTRTGAIARRIPLREGEPYTRRSMFDTRRRLFNLGVFNRVDVEPAQPLVGQATTDVIVRVEDGKPGRLRVGLGYSTEEGPQFTFESSYANVMGLAHEVGIRGEISGVRNEESIYYAAPQVLGSEYDFRLSGFHDQTQEPSFTVQRIGGTVALEREWEPHWRMRHFYTLQDVTLQRTSSLSERINIKDSEGILSKLGTSVQLDIRDSARAPRRGSISSLELQLAGSALGGDFDFVRIEAGTIWFHPVTERTTLAASMRLGWLRPFGQSTTSPLGERFLAGGDGTLRGFKRDHVGPRDEEGKHVGGDVRLLGSLEYRFPLYKQVQGAVFHDFGNVWPTVSGIDLGDMRGSVGAGIRYISPIGALRLDYAHVLDPREGEGRGRIHFGLGYSF